MISPCIQLYLETLAHFALSPWISSFRQQPKASDSFSSDADNFTMTHDIAECGISVVYQRSQEEIPRYNPINFAQRSTVTITEIRNRRRCDANSIYSNTKQPNGTLEPCDSFKRTLCGLKIQNIYNFHQN